MGTMRESVRRGLASLEHARSYDCVCDRILPVATDCGMTCLRLLVGYAAWIVVRVPCQCVRLTGFA